MDGPRRPPVTSVVEEDGDEPIMGSPKAVVPRTPRAIGAHRAAVEGQLSVRARGVAKDRREGRRTGGRSVSRPAASAPSPPEELSESVLGGDGGWAGLIPDD